MLSIQSMASLVAVLSVALFAGPLPAQVTQVTETVVSTNEPSRLSRGLYQVQGTATYFWVDDFGIRHYLKDPETVRVRHFANEPVITVTREEIRTLPVGRTITVSTGPELFKTRDATARLLGKPRIVIEYGSGPDAKRIAIENIDTLKNIEDLEDLEDLEDIFE